jgi:hypothetical protein
MEKLPKEDNKLESQEGGPVSELHAAVEQLDVHATQLEREGSDVDISEETAERIEKKTTKIKDALKILGLGLALYGAGGVTKEVDEHLSSRYEITKSIDSKGDVKFEHEDEETTRILNFLTGAEELSQEDRVHFFREIVREHLINKIVEERKLQLLSDGSYNPEDGVHLRLEETQEIEKSIPFTEEELKAKLLPQYIDYFTVMGSDQPEADAIERINKEFADAVDSPITYDKNLQRSVWEMHQKVGSPRIRWASPTDSEKAKRTATHVGAGRAFYLSSDNTIYIVPGAKISDLSGDWLAEVAHSYQYHTQPVTTRIRSVIDEVKIQMRAISENKTRYEAQLAEYDISGTIEHEAHQVIEKELMDDFLKE